MSVTRLMTFCTGKLLLGIFNINEKIREMKLDSIKRCRPMRFTTSSIDPKIRSYKYSFRVLKYEYSTKCFLLF